ncbi:MAG: hypothetical protein KIS68_07025 [Bauldia sp.]|nr:hypothetical protein [Bauldia sp.]
MKARVVYESIFGNTRAIAEAIAEGLAARFDTETVEITSASESAAGLDLIVIGGPTHAWAMSRPTTREAGRAQARKLGIDPVSGDIGVREWLARVVDGAGTKAAVFDTAVESFGIFSGGSAAKGEAKAFRRAGFELIDEPQQFRVAVKDDRTVLIAGELERARKWGEQLAERAAP